MRGRVVRYLLFLSAISTFSPGIRAQEPTGEAGVSGVLLHHDLAMEIPQLRRAISLRLEGASLNDALRTVAREADLPITYNDAILPKDRRVWLTADDIRTDQALEEILRDSGLQLLPLTTGQVVVIKSRAKPSVRVQEGTIVGQVIDKGGRGPLIGATVVVEGTQYGATTGEEGRYQIAKVPAGTYTVRARYIGYAPLAAPATLAAGDEVTVDFQLERSAQKLDEVVTTGTVVPTERKAIPTPITVVTADDIQRQNLQRVDQVFRGQVPGAIAWDQGPSDYYSTINVRGASSLYLGGTIKTFIDGVEVAFPNFIATIDPNSIERLEITRGPEASTLYGSEALSGVLQIFTKSGRLGLDRPVVSGKTSLGGVGDATSSGSALLTDNTISISGGGRETSYSLGGSYRHLGEWTPSYQSDDWGASVGARTTNGPLNLSVSARYSEKDFNTHWPTALAAYAYFSKPPNQTNHLRQQTYGVTAGFHATPSWQHTLTLGYDQTYQDFFTTQPRFTTPADSLLAVFAGHLSKVSLLYHTDVTLRPLQSVSTTLTAGVNHFYFDDSEVYTAGTTQNAGSLDGTSYPLRNPSASTGYFGQAQVAIANALFLTAGLRAERNANFGTDFGTAFSPRVGASYAATLGPAAVKVRASYGESIRPPLPFYGSAKQTPTSIQLANGKLGPERQRGGDGGIEIYFGRRASLGVTYYNQRAADLIDYVLLSSGTIPTYQYQNVGEISNKGWEFEGQVGVGPVQLTGTYSVTNSTVQRLAPGYSGDYQVGDAVLGVPRHSAGATVSFSPLARTSVTATMTHIGHWTQTDYLALYGFYFGGQAYRGSGRAYWFEYPAVTKFAVSIGQELTRGIGVFLRAENIGNTQRFESDNLTIQKPRSVIVGANFEY